MAQASSMVPRIESDRAVRGLPTGSPPSAELGVGHAVLPQCVGLSKGGIIALLGVRGNPAPAPLGGTARIANSLGR